MAEICGKWIVAQVITVSRLIPAAAGRRGWEKGIMVPMKNVQRGDRKAKMETSPVEPGSHHFFYLCHTHTTHIEKEWISYSQSHHFDFYKNSFFVKSLKKPRINDYIKERNNI